MIIYSITNKTNGKKYIGQTIRSLKVRIGEHVRHRNTVMGRAFEKYGIEGFVIETLDRAASIEELNTMEYYYIVKYNTLKPNGYNLCLGGGNTIGFSHSKESRKKMSKTKRAKGSMVGERNHFFGKTHCKKTRKRMSEAWTEDRRKCLSDFSKSIDRTSYFVQVRNINTGEVFYSVKDAATFAGVEPTNITRVCRGGRKTAGGFKWMYKEDFDKMIQEGLLHEEFMSKYYPRAKKRAS